MKGGIIMELLVEAANKGTTEICFCNDDEGDIIMELLVKATNKRTTEICFCNCVDCTWNQSIQID